MVGSIDEESLLLNLTLTSSLSKCLQVSEGAQVSKFKTRAISCSCLAHDMVPDLVAQRDCNVVDHCEPALLASQLLEGGFQTGQLLNLQSTHLC